MAFDQELVALTLVAEADSQPPLAFRAICWAIKNRIARDPGRFGGTPGQVCLKRMQFSEWNDDPASNADIERVVGMDVGNGKVLDALRAYNEVFLGPQAPDPTRGATHFHAESVLPLWTVGAEMTLKVGQVLFYRGVK